jgi:selenoprotein W-related protein
LAAELLKEHEPEIETISLIPSNGGRFEVKVNDQLVYSKLQSGRHAESGEVPHLMNEYIKNSKKETV